MSFDRTSFGSKVRLYRCQFMESIEELAQKTGIPLDVLDAFERGDCEPTGDHVLILADHFKCDYKFFISNDRVAPFDQTDLLFRRYSSDLSKEDRRAIQEFLFLCECEEWLLGRIVTAKIAPFSFVPRGNYFKKHGIEAAIQLRRHLECTDEEVRSDVFREFRRIGLHVFRRRLTNSNISGVCIRHPTAGPCLLINYSEDLYRQRFTAAHEAAHAILDCEEEVLVSFVQWDSTNLVEFRANTFASHFLIPRKLLTSWGRQKGWSTAGLMELASQLQVSPLALSISLRDVPDVPSEVVEALRVRSIPTASKSDPELPDTLSPGTLGRKQEMLQRGLSGAYVALCIEAYDRGEVSIGRLSEMLLVSAAEIQDVASLFGVRLQYAT